MAVQPYLDTISEAGLKPFVATSEANLKGLDLSVFGGQEIIRLLESAEHRNFHEAYLVSNSLGFGNPDLKMANWVYIDCVLMQTAVIGFCLPVDLAPRGLLTLYEDDPYVDTKKLDYIPVSGQISALNITGEEMTGFSLFSLRRLLDQMTLPKLGVLTKYVALKSLRADRMKRFLGLSQYDNRALPIHARFAPEMQIIQPVMPLHPLRDMSFIYAMTPDLDENRVFSDDWPDQPEPDFLLKADDGPAKHRMIQDIAKNTRFDILPPVHIEKQDGIYLPVRQREKHGA